MGWRDMFWSAYGVVKNTVIEATTNALNVVGSLACMAGGAGFAMSYALDETLSASYFGSATATGNINVNAEIETLNYRANDTIPFRQYEQIYGVVTYNLRDYIHPESVRVASGLLFASGSALRVLAINMKQWHQGTLDKAFYKREHGIDIADPTSKEYLYATSKSLLGSISYSFLSSAVVGTVVNDSGIIGSTKTFTYPSDGTNGTFFASNPDYHGPLSWELFPLSINFYKNTSYEIFGFLIKASVDEKVLAMANTTYGGGLYLESHSRSNVPIAVPAPIGISTYLASTFFAKKMIQERDKRIAQSIGDTVISIPI